MSAVDLKPLRRAHILIVDDDKREGQRLAKQLRDISSEISCIGAATDPVRFTPDAEGLIVKLREALQALGEGREEIFLECALDIPKVIVLDEFLRDPSGSEDPSASRAVKRLIGQIWSKKSKAESVVVRGWSCCVLMYTHLKDLVAFDTEDAEIRGKPWIDFRTKKPVPKSPAEAAEERAAWRDAINALTSLPALTRATYVDLFFGPKGSALIQAIDEAERNTAKPVWVAGRESDGASQVLCCVMNLAPRILVHSQDGFEAWLNQISRARAAPGDAAIALSGEGLTDTERVGATLVRCAPIKFHVWAEWLPPTELRDLFSVVELRPLFEWSLDEMRGLFTARFHRPIRY